jgi:radical SAM superfamily enzyme YgiQ (UPF0313 family)
MFERANGGSSVVLTSDRGSFSEYSRSSALGYFCCLPSRLVPRFLMDHLFAPPAETGGRVEALTAPYALRKVEAALIRNGISDVVVVPPEQLERAVGPRTRVVGMTAHDPFGLSPVSTKLTMLFGGGPSWNESYFAELGERVRSLKAQYRFAVVAGGPGIWQMSYHRPPWVDTVYQGEAEVDLPLLIRSLFAGGTPPSIVQGRAPTLEQIPPIVKAARMGEVQVTRGCPRGCEFCSITPDRYRTVPFETIEREMAVNFAAGEVNVELITDDILLYGAKKLRTNHEAVVDLFRRIKRAGAGQIGFPHISAPAVRESPQTVLEMGRIAEWEKRRGLTPVVGLETGSLRIFRKYMPAKSFPYKPEEWNELVLDATITMNEAGIDPCYTLTIGYPDETNEDVDKSVDLVQSFIDRGLNAFLFPLPVIPITTSRLRGNAMPELETLPERYWDLLSLCWKRDLELVRALLPSIVGRMTNPLARQITSYMAERVSPRVTRLFEQYAETHGRSAYRYRQLRIQGVRGAFRSILWLAHTAWEGGSRFDHIPVGSLPPAAKT